ncbi:Phage holin T7 family, holin superfamily II [Andreprevotia lacus DSM 23236]|jgi:hypothetical protein|uniref:Phage holin T7 family, holin superfamily II n=1 Tax=Andreprevotia lacus DSM 23236 TaxID=1121001 RepID=A0A1W1XT97_9NEIS|nr:hypothetical protein [Andreprevotia lacus]SMC27200.1 Phage holin T7 family, holin superfamily II [Andreprevotia lacus DSM 23236]
MTPNEDTASAVARSAIGLAAAAASSITLNDWVAIATLLYLALQVGLLLPKYLRWWRASPQEHGNERD